VKDNLARNNYFVLDDELTPWYSSNEYLCNYIYWNGLYNFGSKKVGFVHVPEPRPDNENYKSLEDLVGAWNVLLDSLTRNNP
jgi:hypothetical protein